MKILTQENMSEWARQNKDWWLIYLMKEEAAWIEEKGIERWENGKEMAKLYGWKDRSSDETPASNIAGVAGEFATAFVYNQPMGFIVSNSKKKLAQPDVGAFIDVKTRKENYPYKWDLAVNLDQLKADRAYVKCLGCLFPEWVIVCGWAWGHEVKAWNSTDEHSGNHHGFYLYPREKLRAPSTLFDHITHEHRKKTGDFKHPLADTLFRLQLARSRQ